MFKVCLLVASVPDLPQGQLGPGPGPQDPGGPKSWEQKKKKERKKEKKKWKRKENKERIKFGSIIVR